MEFEEKKQHKQQLIYRDTDEMLNALVDLYNERQEREFNAKAKRVSKIAIIHNLVEMKLREETSNVTQQS